MQPTIRHILPATLLFATFNTPAMAGQADYQAEVGYELGQRDYDNSANLNFTSHALSFEVFLDKVKIKNQPLAEAAFMNHISSLTAGLAQLDYDIVDRTADEDYTALLYTHMEKDSPLRFQLIYGQATADITFKPGYSQPNYTRDQTLYGFSIGRFTAQNTAVTFEYIKDEVEYSPAGYAHNNFTWTQTLLAAKHLMPAGNGTMLNIEGSLGVDTYDKTNSADTKNTILELTGEYYPTNSQSIGATFKKVTGDDNGEKGQTIALHGKVFFTPKFSLAAEILQFSGDGTSTDYDELTVNANMRF